MNKNQNSRLAMYRTLRNLFQANLETIKAIPVLYRLAGVLSDLIGKIEKIGEIQLTAYSSKTSVKNAEKETLATTLHRSVSALHALGHELGDVKLQENTDYTELQILKKRDQDLLPLADMMISLVQTHAENLVDCGIDAARITALQVSRDSYYNALHNRDAGLAVRKSTDPKLRALYSEANILVRKRLDRLMVVLQETEPDLYEEYLKARSDRFSGIRHRPPNEVPAVAAPQTDSTPSVQPTADTKQ
jgi:hypothetical protein